MEVSLNNVLEELLELAHTLWLQWKKARKAAGDASPGLDSGIQVLEADQGRYMGFIRMVAQRK
jgi:hypothetical protein